MANEPDSQNSSTIVVSTVISVLAGGLIIVHVARPQLQIDTVVIALLLIALAPWLGSVFKVIQGPAGFKVEYREMTAKLNRVEGKVEEQQLLINDLVRYSVSASIFDHLCGIALLHTYYYKDDEQSRREMYFLRDHGFIRPKPPLPFLVFEKLAGENLVKVAEPTEIGLLCVKLRKTEIPSNMLDASNRSNLRIDPSSL